MNNTATFSQMHPVALRRTSRVIRDASNNDTASDLNANSQGLSSSCNSISLKTVHKTSESTSSDKNTDTDSKNNNLRLVISNSRESLEQFKDSTSDKDSYLSTLVEEYRAALDRKECDNISCYRFKLLSYRISQSLFDRIHHLKELESKSSPQNEKTVSDLDSTSMITIHSYPEMDKNASKLIEEKSKRVQDLEHLLEEQKRLRLQDANQVEEKAARIKEWVANKLKELENQNKRLRDQNKRQKEEIESLNKKLIHFSPISSPRCVNNKTDSIHYIDHSSPLEAIDVEKSLKNRKPQLKKIPRISLINNGHDESLDTKSRYDRDEGVEEKSRSEILKNSQKQSIKFTNNSIVISNNYDRDSPVYDSVTIEQINRYNNKQNLVEDIIPPCPPPHQVDRWESQLYNLADETFSALLRESDERSIRKHENDEPYNEKDLCSSRKSSSSLKNDLISLMKPSFTTIYGDKVVDSINSETNTDENELSSLDKEGSIQDIHSNSGDRSIQGRCRESLIDQGKLDKTVSPNLFDSPMRSRSGKDRMLRTQSVRKNPTPEILYDFITTDLIKRGYLVKPGALKNHNRWFVLKNFQIYSYKNELEETTKATPTVLLKLNPTCHIQPLNQVGEASFPFKISYNDKHVQLIASTAQVREDWLRILAVAISMSDIEPDSLVKHNATYEGVLSFTRHGHTRKCHATLNRNVIFFLRSSIDPTPLSYLPVKGARIRELTDSLDYDGEEKELKIQDCSLAIYPKFSIANDPVYITLGNQQETDKWFYYLSSASSIDQSYGTQFERALTKLMINSSMSKTNKSVEMITGFEDGLSGCPWKDLSVLLYTEKPINQPLTSLPNETLQFEAVELFKSILLFTQVPLEPVAIDYHVSLLQNCLARFLKYPELRNEFYAQLIKQCTYIFHRCDTNSKSSLSSGSSPTNTRSSTNSISNSSSECRFVTDIHILETVLNCKRGRFLEDNSVLSLGGSMKSKPEILIEEAPPPSQSELLQVLQILALSVSLNLPRGRMRWWLIDYLRKFANQDTSIGKYALYTLRAIDRAIKNGTRDNIPSRTEMMSILLRNPYDHSNPHSLPVGFSDGSCLVVETDGSTTVEEFMNAMNDPSGSKDLHILEPQRKVLDIVGWWEQTFRRHNSGRYQNTKASKLLCRKRLVLQAETDETQQERLLIVHQVHNEIVMQIIPLSESLIMELTAVIAQLTFGGIDKSKDTSMFKRVMDKIAANLLPKNISQLEHWDVQLIDRWKQLSGRSALDCVRVYLNCLRRLKLQELHCCSI